MQIEPTNAAEWAAIITVIATLFIASIYVVWAVCVRSQENRRLEWRRIEELVQIVHNGSSKGLWAQKLAIDELITLRRRRKEIFATLQSASSFFRTTGPAGVILADHIDQKLDR